MQTDADGRGRRRTRTDAGGCRRTQTDADADGRGRRDGRGRGYGHRPGHFFIFFCVFFKYGLYGQIRAIYKGRYDQKRVSKAKCG